MHKLKSFMESMFSAPARVFSVTKSWRTSGTSLSPARRVFPVGRSKVFGFGTKKLPRELNCLWMFASSCLVLRLGRNASLSQPPRGVLSRGRNELLSEQTNIPANNSCHGSVMSNLGVEPSSVVAQWWSPPPFDPPANAPLGDHPRRVTSRAYQLSKVKLLGSC